MAQRKVSPKGDRDPSVKHSQASKKRGAGGGKGQKSARGSGPACEKCGEVHRRCSAHNKRGGPCMQMPLRFQQVCRSHGGNTKRAKLVAQERMLEMVWPALARLERIIRDPKTPDAIVVKAVAQVFDRAHAAGLSKQAQVDIGLREPSEWDKLGTSGFQIARGEVEWDDDPDAIEGASRPQLPAADDPADDEYNRHVLRQSNRDSEERDGYLDNDHHDVVTGRVVGDGDSPITFLGEEQTRSRREARRPSSHDPQPTPRHPTEYRDPTDPPEYLRDGFDVSDAPRQRRRR